MEVFGDYQACVEFNVLYKIADYKNNSASILQGRITTAVPGCIVVVNSINNVLDVNIVSFWPCSSFTTNATIKLLYKGFLVTVKEILEEATGGKIIEVIESGEPSLNVNNLKKVIFLGFI